MSVWKFCVIVKTIVHMDYVVICNMLKSEQAGSMHSYKKIACPCGLNWKWQHDDTFMTQQNAFIIKITKSVTYIFILLHLSPMMGVCHIPTTCGFYLALYFFAIVSNLLIPTKKYLWCYNSLLLQSHEDLWQGEPQKMTPSSQQWQLPQLSILAAISLVANHSGSCGCTNGHSSKATMLIDMFVAGDWKTVI